MHRFYAPDIAQSLELPEPESRHAARVLRLADGDLVEVVDGRGGLHTCRIVSASSKRCALQIVDCRLITPHWGHEIALAIAPTKNLDRMEWLVEKATEMGVDKIIPLLCRHSERKELKTDRLLRVAVAAMKQSLKATVPEITRLTPVGEVLRNSAHKQKLIAYCGEGFPKLGLTQCCAPGLDTIALIGPEGDFSPEEVQTAVAAGFVPVSLGESRMRTETAGVFIIAAMHTIDQAAHSGQNGAAG